MATVTETVSEKSVTPKSPLEGDCWVEMPATWKIYTALCKSRGDKSRPRAARKNECWGPIQAPLPED